MFRTRDVSDSRFGLGTGEFVEEDVLLLLLFRIGDATFTDDDMTDDDTGIDELRLLNDESLRILNADSGRCCAAAVAELLSRFVTEFGPDRPIRLPVLLLRLRFDAGPDGLVRNC